MELNKSSPADRPQRPTGLLVIALSMIVVLSWYAGDDLLFALRAERVQAKVRAGA